MNIKFCAPWTSSEKITERILMQYTMDRDLSPLRVVYDESYDVIVFFNHISEEIKPGTKGYLFANEPTWSGNHQKNIANIENITYFTHDKSYYDHTDNIVETPAKCFFGGRGPWIDGYDVWSLKYLLTQYHPEKTHSISSSVTTWKGHGLPKECLYPERYKLIDSIIDKLPEVDFFGGWTGRDNARESPYKIDALERYKFNLVVENQYIKNWVTEKFYDCVLTDTIPIYYGCKNIKEIYPQDGYILLDSIKDPERVIQQLINIHENADEIYNDKINNLRKIRHEYLESHNLLSFLTNILSKEFAIK